MAPLEPSVLTVIVYLPVLFGCRIRIRSFPETSAVSEVDQALLYHLG